MLTALQQHLADIYQLTLNHDVVDFLITDPELARSLHGQTAYRPIEETVLVAEDEEGLALSVYLDKDVLARLADGNPLDQLRPAQLADFWTVLEGISHFNYLTWSANQDKSVTRLELEMQAEVDKFVSACLLANNVHAGGVRRHLHHQLFNEASFDPALSVADRELYRLANDYAGRYCHRLTASLRNDSSAALAELRHFYRLNQVEKISHIHSRAYAD